MTLATKILWLDLETTGLDPETNVILEVAATVAPFSDPFGVSAHADKWVDLHVSKSDWRDVAQAVREMHAKSGLINDCVLGGKALGDIELAVINLLSSNTDRLQVTLPDARSVMLAGSSLTLDRGFIRKYMARLEPYLHYRMYDVSSVREFCYSLGMPEMPKIELAHRGKGDIIASIGLAKHLTEWLRIDLPGENPATFRDRRSVNAFADAMKGKLAANISKPGWDRDSVASLMKRLHEEVKELEEALKQGVPYPLVTRECADVANFCMMVSEQYERFQGGAPEETED